MKTVVLDGHTVNPGDLSWSALRELVDLEVYERTAREETLERAQGAEILLTNKVVIDAEIMADLPGLKYIGVLATGFNVVDIQEAGRRGIKVSNIPSYSTPSVVQHVFGFILSLSLHIDAHSQSVKRGDWVRSPDFCYWNYPLLELSGTTLGVIGYGNIGREVARLGKAFGMEVLVSTSYPDQEDGIEFTDHKTLRQRADFVTLHTVLNEETFEMVNADFLAEMKDTAYLVNTGRGGLINEPDLADALNNGQIAGAGLDVLSAEPPSEDNPLLKATNCIITPHIAWATRASRQRLMDILEGNIRSYLEGDAGNIINADYLQAAQR